MRPLSWEEWPEASRRVFQGFRSAAGEEMILDRNLFVERVLPASILRKLDPAEMDEYRRPFAGAREDRWPTLAWPREIPIDGEPEDFVALVGLLCRMDGRERCAKTVRQCRARCDPDRRGARVLPELA